MNYFKKVCACGQAAQGYQFGGTGCYGTGYANNFSGDLTGSAMMVCNILLLPAALTGFNSYISLKELLV